MSRKIRINTFLRSTNISLGSLAGMFNVDGLRPTQKIYLLDSDEVILKKGELTTDVLRDMSIEELIEYKNSIHRELLDRVESLNNQISNPQLYALSA